MFRDASDESGVAYDYKGSMQAGMGVAAADVSGDGLLDLFVTNFSNEHNSLYINSTQGLFNEASQQFGLFSKGLPWVAWGTTFADFDLDGRLDLVVTNGHVDDNRAEFTEAAPYAEPPLAWRRDEGGFQFLGSRAGRYFAESHVGRALIVVDLDNDGDQDVVVGHQDAAPAVLRNECVTSTGHSPTSYVLRLIGVASNRDAVGTTITMRWRNKSSLQQVKGGGSYLSSHDPRKVFAVPDDLEAPSFDIQWPNGDISELDELAPGINTVREPSVPAGTAQVITASQH